MTQGRSPKNQMDIEEVAWMFVKLMAAVLLFAVMVNCCHAQESPLTKEQSTWVYRGTLAVMAVDMVQSWHFQQGYYETNPILGKHPSKAQVAAYFATFAGLVTLAHYRMEQRALADGLTIGIGIGEAYTVHHNARIGVRIRF